MVSKNCVFVLHPAGPTEEHFGNIVLINVVAGGVDPYHTPAALHHEFPVITSGATAAFNFPFDTFSAKKKRLNTAFVAVVVVVMVAVAVDVVAVVVAVVAVTVTIMVKVIVMVVVIAAVVVVLIIVVAVTMAVADSGGGDDGGSGRAEDGYHQVCLRAFWSWSWFWPTVGVLQTTRTKPWSNARASYCGCKPAGWCQCHWMCCCPGRHWWTLVSSSCASPPAGLRPPVVC